MFYSTEIDERNEAHLRRLDPAFKRLFGISSQVAIYDYDRESRNWKKSDYAGCFFMYERTEKPLYGFIVMNRYKLDNLIKQFDADAEVQSTPPYLLLKHKEEISCIWFYTHAECIRFGELMEKTLGLVFTSDGSKKQKDTSRKSVTNGPSCSTAEQKVTTEENSGRLSSGGHDLLSMLISGLKTEPSSSNVVPIITAPQKISGFKMDRKNNKVAPRIDSPKRGMASEKRRSVLTLSELEQELIPGPAVLTPKNDCDGSNLDLRLFAAGASAPYHGGYVDQNVACQNPSGFVPVQTNTVSSQFNHIFSQLQVSFTNAAGPHDVAIAGRMQTVEQLEREIQEKEHDAKELEHDLRRQLGLDNNFSGRGSDSNGSRKPSVADSLVSSLRGSNDLSAKSPFLTPMTPQSRSGTNSTRSERELTADDLVGHHLLDTDVDVIRDVFENGNGVDLCLKPVQTPDGESRLLWAKTRQALESEQLSSLTEKASRKAGIINPLTKEQLQQGFMHLLQTDPSFVVKLHEAYVASLNSHIH